MTPMNPMPCKKTKDSCHFRERVCFISPMLGKLPWSICMEATPSDIITVPGSQCTTACIQSRKYPHNLYHSCWTCNWPTSQNNTNFSKKCPVFWEEIPSQRIIHNRFHGEFMVRSFLWGDAPESQPHSAALAAAIVVARRVVRSVETMLVKLSKEICSSNGIISPRFGVNIKKKMKPPPSKWSSWSSTSKSTWSCFIILQLATILTQWLLFLDFLRTLITMLYDICAWGDNWPSIYPCRRKLQYLLRITCLASFRTTLRILDGNSSRHPVVKRSSDLDIKSWRCSSRGNGIYQRWFNITGSISNTLFFYV